MPTPPQPSGPEQSRRQREERMAALIGRLAPAEGYTMSALDAVKFLRANGPLPRTPVLYDPCIIVLCSGRKRGFFAGREFVYDAQHFLVLSLPIPFESQTEASPDEPMLAISIRVDLGVLAELALSVPPPASASASGDADARPAEVSGIQSTPLDDRLGDAVVRLLDALTSDMEAAVLGPAILREIYFRVLCGPQGQALRASLAYQSNFGRIGKALRMIHAGYDQPLSVDTLASASAMSVAAFHAAFKSVTGTSPLQYIKATRLHKARMLMIQQGINASVAASQVGYESPSQFSREFKRFFGRSPIDEARMMKEAMALRTRVDWARAA
ncbi:AraC family transcriptional regulator [Cupriavidus gilardii]|uniref:AraC family transcriptional regulator n=2 Tax=Cupriavidus gilardii TaxID=82541 RepID=A0A849BC65_9BURK|nr:AraC family transcriptional regulator [Cupriavidus gilardii]MCT9013135.1 AraC family transcriptional regulator [Cupriavidus gilardii]MCT9052689.1 AraC family transcriptional regulator [Cupriavidus gilardii]NNH13470.1 AraC family transcriptional regulator [Cupriavidus gilardii]WNG68828.1 AraC family transcriptional regulator [Cupriavidus gilardii]